MPSASRWGWLRYLKVLKLCGEEDIAAVAENDTVEQICLLVESALTSVRQYLSRTDPNSVT